MLRDRINAAVKDAMKAQDKPRLSALRLMTAACKDREIALRPENRGLEEADIVQVLQKMVKSRDDAVALYEQGGRPELAAAERAEIAVIREFLPQAMDEDEARAAIAGVIAEIGAAGPKDMGRVMSALKERYAGRMDFGRTSGLVKGLLAG